MYIIQDYNPVSTLNFVFCREMMRIIIRSSINLHKTSITALDGLQVWSIPIGRECSIATATNNPCKYPSGEAAGSQSDGRLDVNCQFYFHHSKCAKKKNTKKERADRDRRCLQDRIRIGSQRQDVIVYDGDFRSTRGFYFMRQTTRARPPSGRFATCLTPRRQGGEN